jgi:hypothetical protein
MWESRNRRAYAADLFLDDLLGIRRRPRRAFTNTARRASAPAQSRADWTRPDLIFDHHAHRAPIEAEELLREVSDEGWTVVATPGCATPTESLQDSDIIVQRALGDGRLAFVRELGDVGGAHELYGPGGLIRPDTLVLRRVGEQPEPGEDLEEFEDLEDATAGAAADSGEAVVHLPMLKAHAASGFTYKLSGPNCVLRWARVPRDFSGRLDVVVHFHGHKAHNAMRLQAKANASGLDLRSPGVSRPTLGLVPHGRAAVSKSDPRNDAFDFPAIEGRDKLRRFLDAGLEAFKAHTGSAERTLTIDRVILTGHSGGGAALRKIMKSIGTGDGAHAFHYFDATYGGDDVITQDPGWLTAALRRDADALRGLSGDDERARVMRERGGSLRILFINGTGTAAAARKVDEFIVRQLRTLVPDDEALRQFLRRYYRAQSVVKPKTVNHPRVGVVFGGKLLADAGRNLDPDARDLTVRQAPTAAPPPPAAVRRSPAEDAPTTTKDGTQLERVRSTIDATLQSFRNIRVSIPAPASREVGVQTPYYINRPTSPSYKRAEQRRPSVLQNAELSRLYNALPNRAKVGKSYPGDIRTFLQGAVNANAVPAQSSGLTAAGMKAFLSDAGVGVDCSGFVSQALNACMAALGRTERIKTNAAGLRGGTGHNTREFDVIRRPGDLSPGDTMWKRGHIRIIHKVEPQTDGSIQFVTAESSSVDLVGAVAKTWKCPQADRFTGLQVERAGTFRANTEVNVFSRYKPLAEVLYGGPAASTEEESGPVAKTDTSTAVKQPAAPAAKEPTPAPAVKDPTPAPAAKQPAPPPTATQQPPPAPPSSARPGPAAPSPAPPSPSPSPAPSSPAPPSPGPARATGAVPPAPGGAPTVPSTLTQSEVDRLGAIQFANGADIDAFFSRRGATGFIGWFNSTWAGREPFRRHRGTREPVRIQEGEIIRRRFTNFWNDIPLVYERPRITALDFAALMCIVLNETSGNFWANPERTPRGGAHPGLAYAFDTIVRERGRKRSYNTMRGNRRAGELFNDPDYIRAHGSLRPADRLSNRGNDYGNAWNSESYPQDQFTTRPNPEENGFIMQADFYKFRGRGVIQTTGRGAYLRLIQYIQAYAGSNSVLADYKRRWASLTPDVAMTVSTNDDWDAIFSQGEILGRAVRLHCVRPNRDSLTMSTQAGILLDVPAPQASGTPRGTPGSIYSLGLCISGRYAMASGYYRDRVLGMLGSMLTL